MEIDKDQLVIIVKRDHISEMIVDLSVTASLSIHVSPIIQLFCYNSIEELESDQLFIQCSDLTMID